MYDTVEKEKRVNIENHIDQYYIRSIKYIPLPVILKSQRLKAFKAKHP